MACQMTAVAQLLRLGHTNDSLLHATTVLYLQSLSPLADASQGGDALLWRQRTGLKD